MTNERKLTDEQIKIINTLNTDEKIIKINAFAGAGKSSTLVEVVKEIRKTDKDSKILYVVFNRSMLNEAKEKFAGLDVECQTTHGFALKRFSAINDGEINVVPALDFNIFIKLKNSKKYEKSWINYKTINELLNAFCLTYDDLDTFIGNLYKTNSYNIDVKVSLIERDFFVDLYNYMLESHIYTHGMYLKSYACECNDRICGYKYVLLDECQDTNLFFYRILKRMKYDKLYCVGDNYQSIYQFCKIVNIFDKLEGNTYSLSHSFRINNQECKLANDILSKKYKDFVNGSIKNYFDRTEIEDKTKKTILFRLNSTLFEYAVNLISESDNIKVHFMDVGNGGNADSFEECFNDMLYFYYRLLDSYDKSTAEDFKNEFRFRTCKITDNYIKISNKEKQGLYQYLCKNSAILPLDYQKYFKFFVSNEIDIIDVIKKVQRSEDCENPNKEYFLSTAHRYKGLEAEHVKIAPDDWSIKTDAEANLCYVACTRATKKLESAPIEALVYGI